MSEEAGTTRDVIEVHLDSRGLPVIVTDTAGIRRRRSAVEAEGIHGGRFARVEDADLVLSIVDATAPEESSAPIAGTFRAIARPQQGRPRESCAKCRPIRAYERLCALCQDRRGGGGTR